MYHIHTMKLLNRKFPYFVIAKPNMLQFVTSIKYHAAQNVMEKNKLDELQSIDQNFPPQAANLSELYLRMPYSTRFIF